MRVERPALQGEHIKEVVITHSPDQLNLYRKMAWWHHTHALAHPREPVLVVAVVCELSTFDGVTTPGRRLSFGDKIMVWFHDFFPPALSMAGWASVYSRSCAPAQDVATRTTHYLSWRPYLRRSRGAPPKSGRRRPGRPTTRG